MYILTNSIKNIIRNRRRYCISGIFLFIVLSVFACAVFYWLALTRLNKEMIETYLPWTELRFRDELQYKGWRGMDSETGEILPDEHSSGLIFNEDGSMDVYNYRICVRRDYFDRYAKIDCVTEYDLGYAELVYREAYDVQTEENRQIPFALYGGSPQSLARHFNDFFSHGYYHYEITQGRQNGKGECLVHHLTAEENGYEVGDTLTFYGSDGRELVSLVISGFYSCIQTSEHFPIGEDMEYVGATLGSTPYYRINDIRKKHIVFTDFDSAYYAYGDENSTGFDDRHGFNNYIAWYKLDSAYSIGEMRTAAAQYESDPNLGFYPAEQIYKVFGEDYAFYADCSMQYMIVTLIISLFITSLTILLMIRERGREIGILYALGWRKSSIIMSFSFETTLFAAGVTLLSAIGALPMKMLREWTYIFFKKIALPFAPDYAYLPILLAAAAAISLFGTLIVAAFVSSKAPASIIRKKRRMTT